MDSTPSIEIFSHIKPDQDLAAVGLAGANFLPILSQFDLCGAWRLDLASGHTFWTRDIYIIHGMEPGDGKIDLQFAFTHIHPEDRPYVASIFEEVTRKKTGFRCVMRLRDGKEGKYKLVRMSGKFRMGSEGNEEIYGLCSQFALPYRSFALIE